MSYLDPLFFVLLMIEYTSSEVVGEGSIIVVVGSIKSKYSFWGTSTLLRIFLGLLTKKLTEFLTYFSLIVCCDTIKSEIIRNGFTFVIVEIVEGFTIFFGVIPKTINFSDIAFLLCQVQ